MDGTLVRKVNYQNDPFTAQDVLNNMRGMSFRGVDQKQLGERYSIAEGEIKALVRGYKVTPRTQLQAHTSDAGREIAKAFLNYHDSLIAWQAELDDARNHVVSSISDDVARAAL
jgi:hypothetical protein